MERPLKQRTEWSSVDKRGLEALRVQEEEAMEGIELSQASTRAATAVPAVTEAVRATAAASSADLTVSSVFMKAPAQLRSGHSTVRAANLRSGPVTVCTAAVPSAADQSSLTAAVSAAAASGLRAEPAAAMAADDLRSVPAAAMRNAGGGSCVESASRALPVERGTNVEGVGLRPTLSYAAAAAAGGGVGRAGGVVRVGGAGRGVGGKTFKTFSKNATIELNVSEVAGAGPREIIRAVEGVVGAGVLLAVRPKSVGVYELTLESVGDAEKLWEGVRVNGKVCPTKAMARTDFLVSFLHLPAYVGDAEILTRLRQWGVVPLSSIGRRYYPGTEIADGTRYVRVRFPPEVVSLPFNARFDTIEGPEYFRVIHDRQVRVCRLCMKPGHVYKTCPDFTCHECHEQGHFARECRAARCPDCGRALISCVCEDGSSEGGDAPDARVVLRGGAQGGAAEVTGPETAEVAVDGLVTVDVGASFGEAAEAGLAEGGGYGTAVSVRGAIGAGSVTVFTADCITVAEAVRGSVSDAIHRSPNVSSATLELGVAFASTPPSCAVRSGPAGTKVCGDSSELPVRPASHVQEAAADGDSFFSFKDSIPSSATEADAPSPSPLDATNNVSLTVCPTGALQFATGAQMADSAAVPGVSVGRGGEGEVRVVGGDAEESDMGFGPVQPKLRREKLKPIPNLSKSRRKQKRETAAAQRLDWKTL